LILLIRWGRPLSKTQSFVCFQIIHWAISYMAHDMLAGVQIYLWSRNSAMQAQYRCLLVWHFHETIIVLFSQFIMLDVGLTNLSIDEEFNHTGSKPLFVNLFISWIVYSTIFRIWLCHLALQLVFHFSFVEELLSQYLSNYYLCHMTIVLICLRLVCLLYLYFFMCFIFPFPSRFCYFWVLRWDFYA
jgi:hypothetical protein